MERLKPSRRRRSGALLSEIIEGIVRTVDLIEQVRLRHALWLRSVRA